MINLLRQKILIYVAKNGWGGRIRTHGWLDQNQLPYHLATPQFWANFASKIKNTTRALFCALVLMISSFSQAYANTDYRSQLLINRNNGFPINLARFYRDGVLYSSQSQLYYNNDKINLLNSSENELGLNINDIYIDGKDFYLATDMGIFQNYRRIFTKEPCKQIIKTPSKIFIACTRGIYSAIIDKKDLQVNFNWVLDEYSPADTNFLVLNKSRNHPEYASAANGFYHYDSRKKKWLNRSYGLKRDFQDSFGFGRFHLDRENNKIYLATSSGVYLSNNQGQTWIKNNNGLKTNANGFFDIRQIISENNKLILLSSTGLYQSELSKTLSWQSIPVDYSQKDENYNPDFYSIDIKENSIIISNSQGQIFNLSLANNDISEIKTEEPVLEISENTQIKTEKIEIVDNGTTSISIENNIQNTTNIALKVLKLEPKIQDLHKIALEFAGIPTGQKFAAYKRQARWRNLIPHLEAFADKDRGDSLSSQTQANDNYSSSNSSISSGYEETNLNKNDSAKNSGLKVSWSLANVVYDPEINDINTSARITANIRENILTELTQIYYARKELLYKLLDQSLNNNSEDFFNNKLKLEEYTAQLDARTGAWFSAKLEDLVIKKLDQIFELNEQEKILAVYI